MSRTADLLQILDTAIHAVLPRTIFPAVLKNAAYAEVQYWLSSPTRYLLCIGKAGVSSAEAMIQLTRCNNYFVLAPKPPVQIPLEIHYGAHPVPDEDSVQSSQQLLEWLQSIPSDAHLLVILSGGSSALLVSPAQGLSLESKREVNELLIRSGASIQEINAVRKHLSRVKGGRLANITPKDRTVVLAVSDVIGDDLSTIGSGPFYPDPSTFTEARDVLNRYELWNQVSPEVRNVIQSGIEGKIPETPKQDTRIPHYVIASNEQARDAAVQKAQELGYGIKTFSRAVHGTVEDVAASFVSFIRQLKPRTAMVVGGEITVKVSGTGTGGRNQHLALLVTELLAGSDATFAAVGTDGVDGNSPVAGAWTDGRTLSRAMRQNLDINQSIENFDAYHFFDPLKQTIATQPTGTNVMDLYLALT